MAPATLDQKVVNLWTARVIPVILVAIVGYVTWVVVVLVCVEYLFKPPATLQNPRPHAAIGILVGYSVLLLFVAIAYFRLLYIVATNPGYVSRGPQWQAQQKSPKQRSRNSRSSRDKNGVDAPKLEEKVNGSARRDATGNGTDYLHGHLYAERPNGSRPLNGADPAPDLRQFYTKDVFTCEGDGRPIWCSTCLNWKPDRSHHCREVGRCVKKMDHFCPWVGGVVSETSFKFFLQFVAWTAVYCTFILIFMAIFVKEQVGHSNVHFIVTLALAALFALFTIGMTLSSLQFAVLNTSTIENLSRKTKVWTLAIYMPRPPSPNITTPGFQTITYPLAPALVNSNDPTAAAPQPPPGPPRTFAILHTKPGQNPWDLGPLRNFKSVMGEHWYDWFLPIKHSPCSKHDGLASEFELGPVVDQMRQQAGIALPHGEGEKSHKRKRRREKKPTREKEEQRDEGRWDVGHLSHERNGFSREMSNLHLAQHGAATEVVQ